MSDATTTSDLEILEAVNGVILPGFFGTELPQWLADALDDGVAGVVYFGQNISARTGELSEAIRAHRANALIATDEEGGTVTRLESVHGSTVPGPAQLGVLNDAELSRTVGAAIAARANAVGINLVFGPVADVNTNPANPVIGVRSFGTGAASVATHVAATVRGIQASGAVAACAKHFPGHGDTHSDSHLALPELGIAVGEIEDVHFEPFRAAIAAGVRTIMTAHIRVPAWGEAPATLNPVILGKLRALGFDGVIVTDALDMAAIRESVGAGPGAVAAIQAGADLLCIGNPQTNLGGSGEPDADRQDYLEVRDALMAAVASGELELGQLRRAADRVRVLATELEAAGSPGLSQAEPDWAAVTAAAIGIHGEVARSGERLSLLDLRARATLAVANESDAFRLAFSAHRALETPARMTQRAVGSLDYLDDVLGDVRDDDDLVVLVDRIGVPGSQREALAHLAVSRPDAVVVNVGVVPGDDYRSALDRIDARASSALSAGLVAELICAGATA
ncbi:beta-N-acetylhexosaminidase [Microterricola gilva]|uniref:Beta-N-acetylhexosaminidase n=1 Tax=Microterricola gilva TaxID=393267 RepID=A0A4Q8AIS4_9MICO|nr:glycoside hydrolase family 3 N-terminal domain-containing protein [Microterricola gilva]RZU64228.1 beta-N-acetylhexosaminidase [Microterricola gilva]